MDETIDLVIIGGGPAALSAAIYAARSGIETVVYEKQHFGGTLTEISRLANYPGFDGPGQELADSLKEQAKSAGATVLYGTCTDVTKTEDVFELTIDGEVVLARTVLVATGSEPVKLELDTDKPISYCALCDAPLYKDKKVLVIGGGNSAVGEAAFLADIAKHVTLINRSPLRAEPALQEKLRAKTNVEIHENTQLSSEFFDEVDGIFVFIGKHPASDFVPQKVLGADGYIKTDTNFMTTIPGLFAAGDVREGAIRQVVTAAAEGAAAAISIANYLKNKQ